MLNKDTTLPDPFDRFFKEVTGREPLPNEEASLVGKTGPGFFTKLSLPKLRLRSRKAVSSVIPKT